MSWELWLLQHEIGVRLSFFGGIFLLMAGWEFLKPCRRQKYGRLLRWSNNLALVFLNSFLLRTLFPAAAVGVAIYVEDQGFGLLQQLPIPIFLSTVIAVVVLDLLIYAQHVLFHKVPILWRLHRVHHADPDYDVTTGARFHPIEIILSMLIKFAAIIVLGAPAVAVIIFEVLLNASAMFNHANLRLPKSVDKLLRWILVTPDMHRVHHSQIRVETDSNYGFALSWWDRIFKTYRAQPQKGHLQMDIGVSGLQDVKQVCFLPGILLLPFKK